MKFDREGWRKEMGLLVSTARKRRDLTQQDVAAQIGLARASYANLESGRQSVACDVLWRIAIVLDVPVQNLMPERAHV